MNDFIQTMRDAGLSNKDIAIEFLAAFCLLMTPILLLFLGCGLGLN